MHLAIYARIDRDGDLMKLDL